MSTATAKPALFPGRLMPGSLYWCEAKDGDPTGLAFYNRHYSAHRYADGRKRKLFCGPGFKFVLVTPADDAVFVWRKFKDDCIDERTGKAQHGHEPLKRAQGSDITDPAQVLDSCDRCNSWLETFEGRRWGLQNGKVIERRSLGKAAGL